MRQRDRNERAMRVAQLLLAPGCALRLFGCEWWWIGMEWVNGRNDGSELLRTRAALGKFFPSDCNPSNNNNNSNSNSNEEITGNIGMFSVDDEEQGACC